MVSPWFRLRDLLDHVLRKRILGQAQLPQLQQLLFVEGGARLLGAKAAPGKTRGDSRWVYMSLDDSPWFQMASIIMRIWHDVSEIEFWIMRYSLRFEQFFKFWSASAGTHTSLHFPKPGGEQSNPPKTPRICRASLSSNLSNLCHKSAV